LNRDQAFRIEPGNAGDVEALEELAKQCGLELDPRAELARPYALLLVARAGERCAGILLAWRAADELHLTDLGVAEEFRRRGIARALVNELLRAGRERGSNVVLLEVRASNAPALSLYRALGFEELYRRARYYADTGEDAVVMRLALR
jgi:ribosomal-protein-alanine N-acetyltransferase